jgi:hypothetical protein
MTESRKCVACNKWKVLNIRITEINFMSDKISLEDANKIILFMQRQQNYQVSDTNKVFKLRPVVVFENTEKKGREGEVIKFIRYDKAEYSVWFDSNDKKIKMQLKVRVHHWDHEFSTMHKDYKWDQISVAEIHLT